MVIDFNWLDSDYSSILEQTERLKKELDVSNVINIGQEVLDNLQNTLSDQLTTILSGVQQKGNLENLSAVISDIVEQVVTHLPNDVPKDYLEQQLKVVLLRTLVNTPNLDTIDVDKLIGDIRAQLYDALQVSDQIIAALVDQLYTRINDAISVALKEVRNTLDRVFDQTLLNHIRIPDDVQRVLSQFGIQLPANIGQETLRQFASWLEKTLGPGLFNLRNVLLLRDQVQLLYPDNFAIRVFAFTATKAYDLTAKLLAIYVETEQGRLPNVVLDFGYLTSEELAALTERNAGVTVIFEDKEQGQVLFMMPVLLPVRTLSSATQAIRVFTAKIQYIPQFQYDMLYRWSTVFSLNVGTRLSDAVESFAQDRMLRILHSDNLNQQVVGHPYELSDESVPQILKLIDRRYRVYDPRLHPGMQVILPYVTLLHDGTFMSAILAPLEYRYYAYEEILDKQPFFVRALPVYEAETEQVRSVLRRYYDEHKHWLIASAKGTHIQNFETIAESVRNAIHPESLPGLDDNIGVLNHVIPELNIDLFKRVPDEYKITLGFGKKAIKDKLSEQMRHLFSQITMGHLRLGSFAISTTSENLKRLPYLLPGITCRFAMINPLDPDQRTIGLGQITKIRWNWTRPGNGLRTAGIEIREVEIKITKLFEEVR